MLTAARALKPKDKVGLIAPGARPESPATVAFAKRVVEEMGFTPVVGPSVLKVFGHFAGTDEQRADDINVFARDESIKALFCVSSGFGALPLLPYIDFKALEDNRKLVIGSDENTTLLLAVHQRAKLRVVLGPNLDRVRSKVSFNLLRAAVTSSIPQTIVCDQDELGDASISKSYSSVEGKASGLLVGGNLSAVLSMMGTPFQPSFENSLLYLDDYNERFDILDRWFTNFYVSGELAKVNGVVFGDFNACGARGNSNILPLEDLFGDRLNELNKPNLFGLPSGHNNKSASIPLGVEASFDTATSTLTLASAAVE